MAEHNRLSNLTHYYQPQRPEGDAPWLLVSFENHWFNVIDLGGILKKHENLCPYEELQLRWLYPSPPQKLFLSKYN
jgi:hypothetical protein